MDRPILFSAPMVRALLDGRKTQTRRVANFVEADGDGWHIHNAGGGMLGADDDAVRVNGPDYAPFAVGDRLWVKETWRAGYGDDWFREDIGRCPRPSDLNPETTAIEYLADGERELGGKTRVSIFMPRWASRLTLIAEEVRVERLNDCSEVDALAEGVDQHHGTDGLSQNTPRSGIISTVPVSGTRTRGSSQSPSEWCAGTSIRSERTHDRPHA